MSRYGLAQGRRAGNRQLATPEPVQEAGGAFASHAAHSPLRVQNDSAAVTLPHYPFQPLPTPRGQAPYRFDLSQLLDAEAIGRITEAGKLVLHTVGDTGDYRGKEMDFVAAMMTADYDASPANAVPAAFYHLGDVVYFAGDIDKYGDCFYETYAEYPALVVSIPGNHDCQPDDPQDGPVDPNKTPLDGWVQNFMSDDLTRPGSLKTTSSRTQMNLPNVYWTFTTPFAIHHPPFSGDAEHSGSSAAEQILFDSFAQTQVWPHLVLSGHVHNYQRFTTKNAVQNGGEVCLPCVVAGNGGYSKLGKLHKVDGAYPQAPLQLSATLSLDSYDQDNFGFIRLEMTANEIIGIYSSAPYAEEQTPATQVLDRWTIPLRSVMATAG